VAHVLVTHRLGPTRSQLSLAKLSNISFSIAYTLNAASGWVHHWRPSSAACRVGEDHFDCVSFKFWQCRSWAEMQQPSMQINSFSVFIQLADSCKPRGVLDIKEGFSGLGNV